MHVSDLIQGPHSCMKKRLDVGTVATLRCNSGNFLMFSWHCCEKKGSYFRVSFLVITDLNKINIVIFSVQPGLTGGSGDTYVRHMLLRARNKGWRVVIFNSRGCADSPVTTPKVLINAK